MDFVSRTCDEVGTRSHLDSEVEPYHVWQDDRSGDIWIVAEMPTCNASIITSPTVSFALRTDDSHLPFTCLSLTLHVSFSLLAANTAGCIRMATESGEGIADPLAIDLALAVVATNALTESRDYTKRCLLEMLLAHLLPHDEDEREQGKQSRLSFEQWQHRELDAAWSQREGSDASLSVLARRCRLSVCHFSRVFKATYGLSHHRFAVKRRIEQGCTMLIETHKPISEIALDCGFADQSSFTRRFSAVKGMSPALWRRQGAGPSQNGISQQSASGYAG